MAFTIRTPPSKETLQRLKENYPEADPDAVDLTLRLRICSHHLEDFMTKHFHQIGLTQARFSILMFLLKSPNRRAKPTEIAKYLGVTRGNMTGLLDNLERDGFICREDDPKDRRVNFVHLKDKALKCLNKVLPGHLERIRKLVEPLSKEERKTFLKCLEKLQTQMQAPSKKN